MFARPSLVLPLIFAVSSLCAAQTSPSAVGNQPRNVVTEPAAGKVEKVEQPVQQSQTARKPPNPVQPTNSAAAEQPTRTESQRGWGAVEWSAVVQAASAAMVVIFTGFLVWYSHKGWKVAKESADASVLSANAAKQSADLADKSLRLLNRPWLDSDDWGVETIWSELQLGQTHVVGLRIKFNIVNPSQTPARIRHIHVLVIKDGPGFGQTNPESINHVLTPSSRYRYDVELKPLRPDELDRFQAAGLIVIVQVDVYFDDLFSKTNSAASGEERWGARRRQFGRRCVLRGGSGMSEFSIVAGAEGVGMNDEDWEREGT